jgi:dehydrogenase/reductase SDR family member 7B
MDFSDKIIWITGASSGIGRELAVQLAAQGARIVLSARRTEMLEKLRDKLTGGAQRHWVIALDLSDAEAVLTMAGEFVQQVGAIDILINNGGISQRSLFFRDRL